MAGNALRPDALATDRNALAPSVLPDGSPDPNAVAGWVQMYRDWQERQRTMPPMGEWLSGLPMQGLGFVGGLRAFHGSPHSFERFDASKIGTGEGRQGSGHGLYFAEKEGTAQATRDALSGVPTAQTPAGPIPMDALPPSSRQIYELLAQHGGDYDAAIQAAKGAGDYGTAGLLDIYRQQGHSVRMGGQGHMYEVNIHANPEHLLDYDKPLHQQSEHVQVALQKSGLDLGPADVPVGDWVLGTKNPKWQETDPAEIARVLQQHGVPGVRYVNPTSREGGNEYAMFDPATIEILRKYGLAGLGLGTAAAAGASPQSE